MANEEMDIKTAVARMRPEYAHCRVDNHDWKPLTVHEAGRNYERVMRCARCTTEYAQYVSKKGGLLVGGRRYTYPEDYAIKGLGYLSSADRGIVRLAAIADDRKALG